MSIMAKRSDDGGLKAPEGTHHAVCHAVWDIGMQKVTWKDVDKSVHKVVVAWEIDEVINAPGNEYNGKRYVAYKRYTLSLSEKSNLYKDLVSWRGRKFSKEELEGFDLERLVEANCMIGLEHNEGYVNVISVIKIPKGTTKMVPENTTAIPEGIQKAMDNQFFVDEEAPPPDTGGHSGQQAEQAIMEPKGEPKCKKCGKVLTQEFEIQDGLCDQCGLPF